MASEIPPCNENKLQSFIEVTSINRDRNYATRSKPSYNFVNFKYCNSDHSQVKYLPPEDIIASDEINWNFKNTDFDFTEELTFLMRTIEW